MTKFGIIATLLYTIPYIVSPFMFIWATNTLFGTGIPITLKTWAAGLILIVLLRYFTRKIDRFKDPYDYYFDDDDEDDFFDEDEDDFGTDPEEQRQKLKDNLIVYRKHPEKDSSPDGSH